MIEGNMPDWFDEKLRKAKAMADKPKYNNYPLKEIQKACLEQIKKGNTIYQKFTCAGCGQRLLIDIPNKLFASGDCDKCGTVTDIAKDGCNYLMTSTDVEGYLADVSATLKKENDNENKR